MSDVAMNVRERAANRRQKRRVNRDSDAVVGAAVEAAGATARDTEPAAAPP